MSEYDGIEIGVLSVPTKSRNPRKLSSNEYKQFHMTVQYDEYLGKMIRHINMFLV